MQLMSTVYFPATSASEFGKKAIDELTNNPYPDFIKRNYYFKHGGDNGLIMYTIYDIEKGNEEAALKDINSRLFRFSQSVEGFKPRLEPIFGFEEAFSLINMAAPED